MKLKAICAVALPLLFVFVDQSEASPRRRVRVCRTAVCRPVISRAVSPQVINVGPGCRPDGCDAVQQSNVVEQCGTNCNGSCRGACRCGCQSPRRTTTRTIYYSTPRQQTQTIIRDPLDYLPGPPVPADPVPIPDLPIIEETPRLEFLLWIGILVGSLLGGAIWWGRKKAAMADAYYDQMKSAA